MTESDLEKMLNGEVLRQAVDIRSMVIDQLRRLSDAEIEAMFLEYLPNFSEEMVKRYLYMKRG